MAKSTTLLLIFALVGIVCPLRSADSNNPEKEIKPLVWPESGRPQLRYRVEERSFDGGRIKVGNLSGSGFAWESGLPGRWEPQSTTPGRFSIAFRPSAGELATFGIAVFDKKEFLPDLTAETWVRVLAGLQKGKEGFRILREEDTLGAEATGPRILGEPTRTILFRSKSALYGAVAELNFFLFHNDKLVVFSLSGSEPYVAANADQFALLISQISDQPPK